ncbi:MAG: thioredoxin family protein [Halanaerobiales bacterium]
MKEIEILGTGCPKCKKSAEVVQKVIDEMGVEAEVKKVEDLNEITSRGVMTTPAVSVEGDVKISGKVPSEEDVRSWFE